MSENRQSPRGRVTTALLDGFVLGTVCFALLLFAELADAGPAVRSILGVPLPSIATLYLLTGAAAGIAVGFSTWLVARTVPMRPARISFALLLVVCAALFVLRPISNRELATFPPRLIALLAASALVVLGGLLWARREPHHESPHASSRRFGAVTVAVVACVLCAAWIPLRHHDMPARDQAPADAPNVVFVLVDALRADRLSCMGYGRPTTPFIDQLAAGGTLFTNAYSHGNRTIIAMPSLFTSIYPSYARAIDSGHWSVPLPDSQTTLAEMFRATGYSTVAMMSNPYLKRPFALTQGFDRVEEFNNGRFHLSLYRILVGVGAVRKPSYAEGINPTAVEVTDQAVAWLGRVPSPSPYFCYVHYMDTHHPYLPPHVFEDMFNSRDWLKSIDPAGLFAKTTELVRQRQPYPLNDDELTRLSDLYDACVRYVDAEVARLVDAARKVNGRPTIVIVTADHGDEFQEHGCLYHNNVVIEELIRVPLVVWRSDGPHAGRRVDNLVRHVDVLPTLAEWIGMPVPARAIGRSLAPLVNGEGENRPRASVAEGDYCGALVEPGWKIMRVDTADAGVLYHLARDPRATRDVARLHRERFQRMETSLDAYFQGVPAVTPGARKELDAATLRQLQALGYIN